MGQHKSMESVLVLCPKCMGRLAYKADLSDKTKQIFECKSCGHWFALTTGMVRDFEPPKYWSVS